MISRYLIPAMFLLLCSMSVKADWLLSDYATPATDSAELLDRYGIKFGVDRGSGTGSVTVDNTVKVEAILDSVLQTGGWWWPGDAWLYQALTPDGREHALVSPIGSFSFEIRHSGDSSNSEWFWFELESQAYTPEERIEGCMPMRRIDRGELPATGRWGTVSVSLSELTFAPWHASLPCEDRNPWDSIVLNHVTGVKFVAKRHNGPALSFEIRNIVIHGLDQPLPPVPPLSGCEDSLPHRVLDLFDGGPRNALGGTWSAYSDTSTTQPGDSTRGTSLASANYTTAGLLSLTSALNKNGGATGNDFHKYAGWAGLSTGFGPGARPDLSQLSGISFTAKPGQWSDNLGLFAKVLMDGVPDEQAHRLRVPASYLDGRKVCIHPSELAQPSWVTSRTAFDLSKVRGFAWETRILSENDQTKSTAFGRVALDSVLLWGVLEPPVGFSAPATDRHASFAARYDCGELRVSGLEGFDRLAIHTLAGERLAELRLGGQPLRVDLQPGMYLLVARDGAGRMASRSLPVMR